MRYYVIINGINSLTIPGLAIKDLPPISKTLMRNQKETIDGRDGDIITELGYSAYDKTLQIGLFGTYDINQIIAFFNQKGTIVFSDEDDKYYNFTILDQIDYEKLVKFRTASVRIHCQPFKYPVSETPVEIEAEYITSQGEDITLNNTGVAALEIGLKGNTSQEGTPTPDNPQEVQVVTGDNTIKVLGKNLFSGWVKNQRVNNTNGAVTIENRYLSTNTIRVNENTQYYIKGLTTNYGNKFVYFYDKDNNYLSRTGANNVNAISFTTPSSAYYCRVVVNSQFPTDNDMNSYVESTIIQLELGNTATDYTPYQSQEYEINLGTLELCKISTYQDYLYKSGENWYKHSEIGKNTLNIVASALSDGGTFKYVARALSPAMAPQGNQKSSNFFSNKNRFSEQGITNFEGYPAYVIANQFVIQTTTTDTIDNFKQQVNGGIVYYPLATPTEEQITNAELIEQLEAILNAVSYEDQTNISQENDNLPFILDVSALQKGSNEAIIDNEGNIYSKPIINIVGDGIVGVSLNGSQILSLDMTTYNDITIDTETMEAYDSNGLRNRQVTGNYNNLRLQPGENTISLNGRITSATISKYKRWL